MENYHLKEIGETIKSERKARKWTQRYLAEKSGIAFQNISLIEKGKQNISVQRLNVILALFDLEVAPLQARTKEK